MKKVYLLLLASVSLLAVSCDKSGDIVEQQPVKQEAQMLPQGNQVILNSIQEFVETGASAVQAVYPYTFTKYTIDAKNGGTQYNTVYFYSDADYTTPFVLPYDMECKYKLVYCGIYSGSDVPEILSVSDSKIARIPQGSSSYVLFEGPYRNMMGGYDYRTYVFVEGVRYINM